jgi:hypothetical protein
VGRDPSCGLMLIASPFPTRFSSGGPTFPLDAWCHHPQSGANFYEKAPFVKSTWRLYVVA